MASLTVSSFAHAETSVDYRSNGSVEFVPNTDITPPVDPENPDPENPVTPIDPTDPEGPNPGTQGPLSIDYASS
ncbi:extracellular protein [Bacillus sp. JCM 19045]|nr:extracellular protein [Bacillus sp. JCM 19045]